MARISKVDLLEGSYQYQWNGTYMQEQAVRVATVVELGLGTTDAALALSLARQVVQQKYPIAQRYPGGLRAVIFGYGVCGISESDDLAKIKIIYDTPYGAGSPPGGGTPFVVTDTTSTERVTTGFCPGPDGVPIQLIVAWKDKNNKNNNVVWPGTMSYDRTLRTVTSTGIVTAAQLNKYRQYANYVNKTPWNGLGIAYWRLSVLQTSTIDLGAHYTVQLQAQADTSRDQSEYIGARNPNAANRVIVVDPAEMKKLAGQAYAPLSVLNRNATVGIIRSCPYNWTNFRNIFGFG